MCLNREQRKERVDFGRANSLFRAHQQTPDQYQPAHKHTHHNTVVGIRNGSGIYNETEAPQDFLIQAASRNRNL